MSKIGRQPIAIPEAVTVTVVSDVVSVVGPKGGLTFAVPQGITIAVSKTHITVSVKTSGISSQQLFGLTRAVLANMVEGVVSGFEKKLTLSGVGYRAAVTGKDLLLSVGYSHPVKVTAPEGVNFSVAENIITIAGIDKNLIGDIAARIRAIRPPEPYKGKGIAYQGEWIRRKVGKAAKVVGTK